ncbi:MAG TPA: helix-turn-helix transcriptional regulator [Ilumatobacteraceae bacterium]
MQQDHSSVEDEIEATARRRLRSLRVARGWTLDELARRSLVSASTISRIETGHRRLAIGNLAALARALEINVDELLDDGNEDDVVIRPRRNASNGIVHWPLTHHNDSSGRIVTKMRIGPSKKQLQQQVHPGRDWFYVLEGTARLVLGDREHLVAAGQAAEFSTMTPHAISGYGGPVELIAIFDRHGDLAHLRPTNKH